MPLPTLKELLERFPDGFYGCFAANWSEMDYKSGGTEVEGGGKVATSLLGRPRGEGSALLSLRQAAQLCTVRTSSGPLLSVGRARSMKLGSKFGLMELGPC